MKIELSGYLTKLENDYSLISRYTPMFQKTNRNIRYQIEDNFLRVWFRYIYKYGYMIEVGANKKLKMVMDKSYTTYTGKVLERYFIAKMIESEEYTRLLPGGTERERMKSILSLPMNWSKKSFSMR